MNDLRYVVENTDGLNLDALQFGDFFWYTPDAGELRLIVNEHDLTDFFTEIEWGGNDKEAARRLTFSRIYSDAMYVPMPEVGMHHMVQLYQQGEELFRGYIVNTEQSLADKTIPIVAMDAGFFLMKNSESMQVEMQTPDAVAREVCARVGVPVGETMSGEPFSRVFDNDTIYSIIMTGYTLTSRMNGVPYCLEVEKGAVNVRKKGERIFRWELSGERDIYDSKFGASSEDAVNRVKIYDENGQEIGMVQLPNAADFPGVLQAIHNGEGGEAAARQLLKNVQMQASVSALGYVDCVTNTAAVIKEPVSGLSGLFYITADKHTWQNGQHHMELTLAFENLMDEVVSGSEPDTATADFDQAPGNTNAARAWNFLRAKGYSAAATAGILGNLEAESGIDPKRLQNGRGPGTGIAQWENPGRWPLLVKWAQARGKDPWVLETQLDFLVYELEGGEATTVAILNSRYGGLSAFKNATDPKWAADAFQYSFERAGTPNMQKRYQAANKYFNDWKTQDKVDTSAGSGKASGKMTWPVPGKYNVTSPFGRSSHRSDFHLGTDIGGSVGTPIVAADGGTVELAGAVGDWSYGVQVLINHGSGVKTRYAHLTYDLAVSAGQKIDRGARIGYMGMTGNTTGPHLHFEVVINGNVVNPMGGYIG